MGDNYYNFLVLYTCCGLQQIHRLYILSLFHLLAYCEDQDRVNTTFYILENLAESKEYYL